MLIWMITVMFFISFWKVCFIGTSFSTFYPTFNILVWNKRLNGRANSINKQYKKKNKSCSPPLSTISASTLATPRGNRWTYLDALAYGLNSKPCSYCTTCKVIALTPFWREFVDIDTRFLLVDIFEPRN